MASEPIPTITLGPLAQAIDVAVIEDWLAGAGTGDELVYAWGVTPPRHLGAWSRARTLADEGEVRLHDRLQPGGKTREWYLKKREIVLGEAATPAPVSNEPESEGAAVLRILRRAVNLKHPCPTNAEIGAQVGLTGEQVAYRVRVLVAAKAIHLEQRGPRDRRVLTIGGKSTPMGTL